MTSLQVFDQVLARYGERREDHYAITRLDPGYRIVFGVNGSSSGGAGSAAAGGASGGAPALDAVDVPGTEEGFLAFARGLDPSADMAAFFADAALKYRVGMERAIWQVPAWPLPRWLFSWGLSPTLITRSLREHIAGYTANARLREVLEWPSQFLGMDAGDSPSLYALLTYSGACRDAGDAVVVP